MKATTVEARIKDRYDSTVVDFFQSCIDDGMETYEIAELIETGVM